MGKGEDWKADNSTEGMHSAAAQDDAQTPRKGSTLQKVLDRSEDVAVLPQVVYKIVEMTAKEGSSATELEKSIVIDPGFSARILKVANSAAYALPKKVTSIREAVMFLGFKQVRQLAMTVGVFNMFVGKTDGESLRRRAWWRHSLDSAVCSQAIARSRHDIDPDEAYTTGLLHYIGKTLLDRVAANDYHKITSLMESGASDLQAEKAVYGCTHVDIAMEVADSWGFPEQLVGALGYIHRPEDDDPWAKLRSVTALGDRIALVVAGGDASEEMLAEATLPKWPMDILAYPVEDTTKLILMGRSAIESSMAMSM